MNVLLPVSVVALLLCLCPVSQSLDYCVVPDTGDCDYCPLLPNNAPCNTLQYYANNFNFTSNSIFHFLEGEHTLSTVVEVTNVANLTLVGVGPHQNLNRVECTGKPNAAFVVRNFANFTMKNLCFHKCGGYDYPTLHLINGSSRLSIDRITASRGIFLDVPVHRWSRLNPGDCAGPINIYIDNCEIMQRLLLSIMCPNVLVHLTNSVMRSDGVNFDLDTVGIYFLEFTDNFIEMNNITISNGSHINVIAGDILHSMVSCVPKATLQPHNLMEISNMTITSSTAPYALLSIYTYCNAHDQHILIRDSIITKAGIDFVGTSGVQSQVTFKNVSISSITPIFQHYDYYTSTASFLDMLNVTFIDCTFENNQMTAILAVRSKLIFQGNNTFKNNSAVNGAGIMLLQNSYLYLNSNTSITFADNHASEKGGAMYIDGNRNLQMAEFTTRCNILCYTEDKKQMHFLNNTAGRAGSSLYWMTADHCGMSNSIKDFLQTISNLQNTESDPSAISSDPIRICQCLARHHMPNCNSAFPPIRAYPGEAFTLRLAAVGTMNGTVPGNIYAKIPQTSPPAKLW